MTPSFNPGTGLFYLSVWEYATKYYTGRARLCGRQSISRQTYRWIFRRPGSSAVRAIQPRTGEIDIGSTNCTPNRRAG